MELVIIPQKSTYELNLAEPVRWLQFIVAVFFFSLFSGAEFLNSPRVVPVFFFYLSQPSTKPELRSKWDPIPLLSVEKFRRVVFEQETLLDQSLRLSVSAKCYLLKEDKVHSDQSNLGEKIEDYQ